MNIGSRIMLLTASTIIITVDRLAAPCPFTIPPMTPFVGRSFNLTRAGIHADGMMKDPEIYNIFDTEALLGRAPKVAISATSGVAGVAFRINEYRNTIGEAPLPKTAPVVQRIYEWVCAEYDGGRITVITDEELISKYHEFL